MKKNFFTMIAIALIVALTFRSFWASVMYPVELVLEALLEGLIFLYILYRLVCRIIEKNYTFSGIEIYLGILFIFPIIPAFAAWREFDQPMFFGVATYRDFYLLFGGLIVYNLLKEGYVSIKTVEHSFVTLALIYMFFSYFLTIFIDPVQFQDTAISGANPEKGGDVYYRLNMSLFFFGSVYFTVKSFYQKNLIYLGIAALFIFYVVFIRLDRTSIAVLGFGLGVFFLTALPAKTQVLTIFRALIPLTTVALIIAIFKADIYEQYYHMFLDVFNTAGKAGSGSLEDNIRLMEVDIAVKGFLDSPIFGKGKISTYFLPDGYNHFYGFFYTSDVGIFGYLFSAGVIGLGIVFFQFVLAIKYIRGIKYIKQNVFLVTLKITLLIHALDAITTEYLTLYSGQTLTMILLIFYFYQRDRVIQARVNNGESIEAIKVEGTLRKDRALS
ncbi:O-antigen ligase family protein [Cryomorphaceae bacterium 1068]|nr:O-antigen ligase family protein [Cryomorphaceae bacterium 1068]